MASPVVSSLPVQSIMDKAATADRRALFAAVQQAVGSLIDLHYCPTDGPSTAAKALERMEAALVRGYPA